MKLQPEYDIMHMARQSEDGTIDKIATMEIKRTALQKIDDALPQAYERMIDGLLKQYYKGIQERIYYPTDKDTSALTILFNLANESCKKTMKETPYNVQQAVKTGILINMIEQSLDILTRPIDDRLATKE